MSTTSRLFDAIKELPASMMADVIGFVDFLWEKRLNAHAVVSDEPITSLAGGVENSKSFAGDPMVLQTAMRNECL